MIAFFYQFDLLKVAHSIHDSFFTVPNESSQGHDIQHIQSK